MSGSFDPTVDQTKPPAGKGVPGSSTNGQFQSKHAAHPAKPGAKQNPNATVAILHRDTGHYSNHSISWYMKQPLAWTDKTQVKNLQQQLIDAGYLNDKKVLEGVYDAATQRAYKAALLEASTLSTTFLDLVGAKAAAGIGAASGRQRQPFSFQPPDPADVRKIVQAAAVQELGGGLTDDEIGRLTAEIDTRLRSSAQSAYSTNISGGTATSEFDPKEYATQRARELHPGTAKGYGEFTGVQMLLDMIGQPANG